MERTAMADLVAWKSSARRKPLLLQGARQVGKTWLLREFGRRHYSSVAYANFEENEALASIFAGDLDPQRMLIALRAALDSPITPGDTLLILDEIQACPRALTALKYFQEQASEYHIACAGSLLGVAIHEGTSFPVGKVSFLDINPLSFREYLAARGHQEMANLLETPDWDVMNTIHQRFLGVLNEYMVVGGMPEPVTAFIAEESFAVAREVQGEILQSFDRDFSKHVPADQLPKVRSVWSSIPAQLAKEQKRFRYADLGGGARARSHVTAVAWLVQAGLALRADQVTAPRLPLPGYQDSAAFKLFGLDVGLLGAMSQLSPAVATQGDRLYTEFKGSLAEQFVASELHDRLGRPLHYWVNQQGRAEVDFLIQREQHIVPIEVKSGQSNQAKSLRIYRDKYAPVMSVRTSLQPYKQESWVVNLPLYAIGEVAVST
jgi:predicted AAA+ superfamily ATPase